VPAGAAAIRPNEPPARPPVPLELPFSRDRTWSIVVVDEGPVEPDAGHFRYSLTPDQEPFLRWVFARGVLPDQLTVPKLDRLMMRLQGLEYRPFLTCLESEKPVPAVRLDFPAAERRDVLEGLLAFAADDACAARLSRCYAQLPRERKAL
jgi:hypothetical protein